MKVTIPAAEEAVTAGMEAATTVTLLAVGALMAALVTAKAEVVMELAAAEMVLDAAVLEWSGCFPQRSRPAQ